MSVGKTPRQKADKSERRAAKELEFLGWLIHRQAETGGRGICIAAASGTVATAERTGLASEKGEETAAEIEQNRNENECDKDRLHGWFSRN